MKRLIYLSMLLAVALFTSCSSDLNPEMDVKTTDSLCYIQLNLAPEFTTSPMTRTETTNLTSLCTNIDIYITGTNCVSVAEVHQVNTDPGFGSATIGVPQGAYKTFVYAHNGGTMGVYNNQKRTISFPSFFASDTFAGFRSEEYIGENKTYNMKLKRIVSKFRLVLTDGSIPSNVAKIRIKVKNVLKRYIPETLGIDADLATDYVYTDFDLSTYTDNKYDVMFIPKKTSSEGGTIDVVVEAILDDGSVLETRTFNNVEVAENCITTYTGALFDPAYMAFRLSIDPEWGETGNSTFE